MELELKQYLIMIYKRLWIALLLPLIAAGTSAYISFYVLTPVYESNTTLYVINKKAEPQMAIAQSDLMVGQLLVKDYRELMKSRTVTSSVIKELGLIDMTTESLAAKINVNAKNDTRLIEIKVQDESPARAKEIADKLADVFINKVVDLMKVENVSIVDRAVEAVDPVKPRPLMNIAIAAFAGLLAAFGIIFLIEYLDDTIKTSEDVEKHLGLTVLGTIPVLNIK